MIREKVLYFTKEEVPHSVTCTVELMEEDKKSVNIGASIIVDRENIKKILIGKQGTMIKKIGTQARKDIENLLGKCRFCLNHGFLILSVFIIKMKWTHAEVDDAHFGGI